jgi:Tfp pilus assembly protein PilO
MKKYFAHLRPMERRIVIGVAVVVFLVINAWQVWPHFSDWGDLRNRQDTANRKLAVYQTAVAQIPKLQAQVNTFASAGQAVALEDQGIDLMRTIQAQASASGFGIQNFSPQTMHTNDAFFVEQVQNITVTATEAQLVDFLYKLGSGASMIRVRDLALQPDGPHYHLSANIRLVASYQKNSTAARSPKPSAPAPANDATIFAPAKPANIFGGAAKGATNSPAKKP